MSKQPRRLVQEPTLSNTAPMMVCAAVLITVLAVYFFIVNTQSWLLFAAVMCVAVAALIVGLVSWVGFNRDQAAYADYIAERDDALRHNDAVVERERAGVAADDVILSQDPVESDVDWDDQKYAVDADEAGDEYATTTVSRETSPAAALVGAAGTASVADAGASVELDGEHHVEYTGEHSAVEFEQAPEEPSATTLMDEVNVTESDVDEAVADEGGEGVLFGDDEVGQIDSEGASDPVLDEFFAAEGTDLPADEYEVAESGSSLIELDTTADADADADADAEVADTKDEQKPSLGGFSLLGFTDEETK